MRACAGDATAAIARRRRIGGRAVAKPALVVLRLAGFPGSAHAAALVGRG